MSYERLRAILESCGQLEHLQAFEVEKYDDSLLREITEEVLANEIGIKAGGDRKKILKAIQSALAPQFPPEPTPTTPAPSTAAPSQDRTKIFLSYGRRDAADIAERLYRDLTAAGFEVWRDTQKIRSASLWQDEIEAGLRSAQVVVSLLSPQAVRRGSDGDSTCLDELAYARHHSQPPTPIVPAMVAPCDPPFCIYRLDYVHLMDWRNDTVYQAGLKRLIQGIHDAKEGKTSLRPWEAQLRSMDFTDYLHHKRRKFVGREWLFEEIDLWRYESEERALLITGDPGAGKSSVVAQLVHNNSDGQVIGYHCCQSNEIETLRPSRFVQSLAAMIASRLPDYAAQLEVPAVAAALDEKRCESDPSGAFLEGILQPLHALPNPEEGVRYILVDALDEAMGHAGSHTIVDVLASRIERLPPWLRIVATTRKEPLILQKLSALRAKSIDASDPRNLADLGLFVRTRLQGALAEKMTIAKVTSDDVVKRISERSGGNFLYAVNVLDGLERDHFSFNELDKLPQGLNALYLDFFQRLFGTIQGRDLAPEAKLSFQEARPLLEVLVATREPLTREEIAAATGLDLEDDLPMLLRKLGQILSKRMRPTGEETLAYFHKSVADWLSENPDGNVFFVSPKKGGRLLASYCAKVFSKSRKNPPLYARKHAVAHFLGTGDWDNATTCLSDLEFIEARSIAQELSAMLEDYAAAAKLLPEGESERRTQVLRQAELDRYAQEMYQYAAAWSRIRSGSSEAEPTLPRPVQSVRLWTTEEIEAERKRITDSPNRLDIVKAFRIFVATNTTPLQRYCEQEGFAANLARNDAPEGPVHEEGKRRLEPLKCIKLIKRFSPEEIYNPLPACQAVIQFCAENEFGHRLALCPDGVRLVSGGRDIDSKKNVSNDASIKIWNLESLECLQVLKGHAGEVSSVVRSVDGKTLISAGHDKTLRVWDMESGECLRVLEGHTGEVYSVALSTDGEKVVSGSQDKTVRIWDAKSGKCLRVLRGHKGIVHRLSLGADGSRVFSESQDNTSRVWSMESGKCLKVIKGNTGRLAQSADGRRVVLGSDKTLRVCDVESGECLRVLTGHTRLWTVAAMSADGGRVVSGSVLDKTLLVWDVDSGECMRVLTGHTSGIRQIEMSADGGQAVSGSNDGTLRVWNLESGECVTVPNRQESAFNQFVLSADGQAGVSRGDDATLGVWDMESGRLLKMLPGQFGNIEVLALSGDGVRIVSGGDDDDGTVRVWDMATGACLKELKGHASAVIQIVLSGDGRRIVSGSADTTIRVWDVETGKCLRVLRGHLDEIYKIALSPDGRNVISASRNEHTLRLSDLKTGECLKVLDGHTSIIGALALTADGRRSISGSYDETIRIWDTESGQCLKVFEKHSEAVTQNWISVTRIVPSPDGKCFFAATNDNTLQVWDLERGKCVSVFHLMDLSDMEIHFGAGRLVSRSSSGRVEAYNIENLPLGPFITTAQRKVISEDLPAGPATARPACCGKLIDIPEAIAERIDHWTLSDGKGGYNDPALEMPCPQCGTPLKMNPFFLEVR